MATSTAFKIPTLIFTLSTMGVAFGAAPSLGSIPCEEAIKKLVALSPKEKWRIPLVEEVSPPSQGTGVARANHFLETLAQPVILQGPAESAALKRVGILLEGGAKHSAKLADGGNKLHMIPAPVGTGGGKIFDGVEYLEFPNSTIVQTLDSSTQKSRSFLLARGVRRYTTDVDLTTGQMSPQGYVSDVLMFEVLDGKAIYRSRLLDSKPEAKFFFEDPRISVLHFPDGTRKTFLSGTDYSPHFPGAKDPDVMNRYVELKVDKQGLPLPIETKDGIPKFSNLSPFPKARAEGAGLLSVDSKNATIAFNEQGNVVVRTRLRPDFNTPEVKAMAHGDSWKYGEQVFVFKDYKAFEKYDWNHSVEDLFSKGPTLDGRARPLLSKVILKDSQLKELHTDPTVYAAKGKGMGPGTAPIRVVRRGDQLFVSDGKNATEMAAGKVPKDFVLKDGEVIYVAFDHEIRYFKDTRGPDEFLKRHYSLSIKQFDPTLSKVEAYYADALSPRMPHELGYNSGIADLQHVYPMGREVLTGADGVARVRVSLGVSDAHTELVEVDILTLMNELTPGSLRWKSGQVYKPE